MALRASKDRLWPDNDHELFLKELQRIEFVDRRKTGDEDSSELVPGTQEFTDRMAKAGLAIASLLVQMRRRREANFSGRGDTGCRARAKRGRGANCTLRVMMFGPKATSTRRSIRY